MKLSEYAPLVRVLLCKPQFAFSDETCLHYQKSDAKLIAAEISNLALLYESLGVAVSWLNPTQEKVLQHQLNDYFFCRDQIIRLPDANYPAPMGVKERSAEYEIICDFLGPSSPISGLGSSEGADILWASCEDLVVGVGKRTSLQSALALKEFLAPHLINVHMVAIEFQVCQHLLGVVQFISKGRALVRSKFAPKQLLALLDELKIEVIDIPEISEVSRSQAMNVVLIDEQRLVMPTNCPQMRTLYQSLGFECFEVDISESIKAAGGIACLTGILERKSLP